MKLLRHSVSLVVIASGIVGIASSCSSGAGDGFGDGGFMTIMEQDGNVVTVMQESDGAVVELTDGGAIQVTLGPDGGITVTPGQEASTSGSDATVGEGGIAPGSDAMTAADTLACPDTGAAPVCSPAPTTTGGLALASNYFLASNGVGNGGYAYAYSDSMNGVGGASASCIEATQLCARGTIDVANATGTFYGAGIGFNLNQAQSTTCASMPILPYTVPTSVGISYKLSSLPSGGARLIIGNAVTAANGTVTGVDYCAPLPSASGTIAWTQFNSECWTDTGVSLTGAPTGPIHINIGLPSLPLGTAAASPFDFCVDSLAFATTLGTTGGGGTVTSCGGAACCEPTTGPSASGDGSLTCYTFDQGTPGNKTYCGYQGTESAGPGGSGACQAGALNFNDTVPNVGTASNFFAAFPGPGSTFGNGSLCGLCVNVTYAPTNTTIMATVVDECPSGSNSLCGLGSNHLDMSAAAARALGYGVGGVTGSPTGVTWEAVACPISSDIVEVFNGSSTQVYFQNVVWPVATVKVNGVAASQPDGYWQLPAASGPITLTDAYGHSITGTLPGTNNGSLGTQFPATCP